jgi:hypothetical protein
MQENITVLTDRPSATSAAQQALQSRHTDGTTLYGYTGPAYRRGPYSLTFGCPCVSLAHRTSGTYCGATVQVTEEHMGERNTLLRGTCNNCVGTNASLSDRYIIFEQACRVVQR